MFDQLLTSTRAVERYSSGPLLEERRRYMAHCAAQGSTRSSLRLIAQHQLVAIEYLHLPTADSLTVEEMKVAALALCEVKAPPNGQPAGGKIRD